MQEPGNSKSSSSTSNEINSKLLEQSNTNVGDIADNYFILFKKPSSEDDDEEEDVPIDDDDVLASDSDDIVLDDSSGGGGSSSSSSSGGEPLLQSTSTTSTTTEQSLSTATTTTASTTSLEGHFDSVNRENAFAETTETNILKTRKARDDEDGGGEKEFSSHKGYYHFTGNRLPSSALSSFTSTSTSSNYTKVGVTNQDDMGESLYLSILFSIVSLPRPSSFDILSDTFSFL